MGRLWLRLIAFGAGVAFACASVHAQSADSLRIEGGAGGGASGGIAGVDFWQSFESFNLGPGGGQQGWGGAFQIVDTGIPGFGQRTARTAAGVPPPGMAQFDTSSPIFTLQTGTIRADIIINNNTSLFQFLTVNTLGGAGFFNTRLNFEANGAIRALQIVGPPPCATGAFADTTGTWTPGVKMRIGIEVLPGNIMRVYKDDVQIFQGHDIAQFCAAGDPDIGINQVRSFNSNVGTTAQMHVDNISSLSAKSCETPLPPCSADIQAANGVVDVNDLLQIISDWGATGPPRPPADCAPPPNGDCQVDVLDMLAVLSQWGPCPEQSGACCTKGVCDQTTEAACAAGGGEYQGDNTQCANVICPVPVTNDECVDAATVTCGQTVTITSAQLESYTVNASDPVTSCEIASGGPFLKDRSLWYKLTTAGEGSLALSLCTSIPSSIDTILSVFSACGGQQIACDDDECVEPGFGASEIACFNVEPSTQYIILVQRYQGGGTGTLNLVIDCTCAPPCMIGFDGSTCPCATPLQLGVPWNDSIGGPVAAMPVCQGVGPGIGSWHRIEGTGQVFTATTCASPVELWDAAISVYCGTCGNLACVGAVNADSCGALHESVSWCTAIGIDYYIVVHSQSGNPPAGQGNYTIQVTSGANCSNGACGPGSADSCVNALPIGLGTTAFSTVGASTDGVPNAPGQCSDFGENDTHNDIWYAFTAPASGALILTTCAQLGGSSNYDSDLVLYSNSAPGGANCPPLDTARIACNDDDQNNPCGTSAPFASTAFANVIAGQNYRIRVGGWGPTNEGTGVLNLVMEFPSCGNGIVEIGEQCDDGNNIPNDGCFNCICEYVEPANCEAEGEQCLGDDTIDITNGGCNSTPTVYGTITVNGPAKCGEGSTYAVAGTPNHRDTDWYRFVVPATANHHIEGRAEGGWLFGIVSGVQAPGSPCVGAAFVAGSSVSTTTNCNVVGGTVSLTPAAYAVFSAPAAFNGFPCSSGPHQYNVRLRSP